METPDYSQYLEAAQPSEQQSQDGLAKLARLAVAQDQAQQDVDRLSDELKAAQQRLNKIAESEIPELMDELGMEKFTTKDGFTVAVKETLRTSLSANRKEEAFKWLRDNGYGAILKRKVFVEFGRGEDAVAEELFRDLLGKHEVVEDQTDVHSATLKAFLTERLKEGVEIPLELFGAFRQRRAIVA